MIVTFKAFLDERHQKADTTYPLKIRITGNRKQKEIPLSVYLKENEWDKGNNRVTLSHPNFKLITLKINQTLSDLQEALLKFETSNTSFTLDDITTAVTQKNTAINTTFFSYADQQVKIMIQSGRIGNAIAYKNATAKLLDYTKKKELRFESIDYKLLENFTSIMLSKGTKVNTVAMYMREIRAIYNRAIKEGIIDYKHYPFNKYKIKNAKTISRTLTIEEMKKIIECKIEPNTPAWHSRNYFLLSFCLIGINFTDLFKLTPNSLQNGRIIFSRSKTKKIYSIYVQPMAQEILSHYFKPENNPDFLLTVERTEFKLKGKKNSFQLLTERDVNTILRELNLNHIKCTISTIRSLLNSDFILEENPFEEYFTSLPEWSNKEPDYIEQLANTITAENDTFWNWAFKKWLVNLVACALEGTITAKELKIKSGINQQVLVFVGNQGIGKTTWLNDLLPVKLEGYLFSGIVNPSNKDTLVNLSENLIINLDELENLNKTELGSLKSLITLSAIRLRRAYGIYNENIVRRASFVGSVNEAEFLTDTTGNRRYIVIETTVIDYKHKVSMDKVYSQAYNLYQTKYEFEFKREDITRIDENNNKFIRQSAEEELLLKHYRIPLKDDKETDILTLTPTDIINELQEETKIKLGDQSSIRRLGSAMHKHNFQKISKGNSKPYQLVRITPKKSKQSNNEDF